MPRHLKFLFYTIYIDSQVFPLFPKFAHTFVMFSPTEMRIRIGVKEYITADSTNISKLTEFKLGLAARATPDTRCFFSLSFLRQYYESTNWIFFRFVPFLLVHPLGWIVRSVGKKEILLAQGYKSADCTEDEREKETEASQAAQYEGRAIPPGAAAAVCSLCSCKTSCSQYTRIVAMSARGTTQGSCSNGK